MDRTSTESQKKGLKLAQERERLGFTQVRFARRARVSAKTIWAVEQGMPCRQWTKRSIMRALKQDWTNRAEFFVATPQRRR